jgi:drug/metabolite transporter (DMT)-like permease
MWRNLPMKISTIFKALLAVVVWGASFVATKIALRDVPPIVVVTLRFAIGVVVLWAALRARRLTIKIDRRDWPILIVLGFDGIWFHQMLQSTGLAQGASATNTGWYVALIPIFAALLAAFFLKETVGPIKIAGIVLATFGVLLVVSKGNLADVIAHGLPVTTGDALALASAPNWAIFSVISKSVLKRYPPTVMMTIVMTIGWLLLTPVFILSDGLAQIAHLTAGGWVGVLFLGVACSGLAYIFWYDVLHEAEASSVSAFLYIEPIVTVIVAAIVLKESIVPATLIGGATILLGVWLVSRSATHANQARVPPTIESTADLE